MDIVEETYSDKPFPSREAEDEKKRLIKTAFGNVRLANSVFWGGKKKLGKFRVLDAGCGTGDVAIHLADQLKGTGAEIVALDISAPALEIVRKRADVRGLDSIRYVRDSILNLPNLKLGKFDYVVCASVLPHLENPAQGLKILSEILKDDGGMALQVYAKYGRMPISILQELVREVSKDEKDSKKKLAIAKEVFDALPPFNWMRVLGNYNELQYDTMLESGTKTFTVPELYDFIESAGLHFLRFKDRVEYDPDLYTQGKINLKEFSKKERESIAELMNSRINSHRFFVAKSSIAQPDPADFTLVPEYIENDFKLPEVPEGKFVRMEVKSNLYARVLKVDKRHVAIMEQIDGKKPIQAILAAAASKTGASEKELAEVWKEIYEKTKGNDVILLNRP